MKLTVAFVAAAITRVLIGQICLHVTPYSMLISALISLRRVASLSDAAPIPDARIQPAEIMSRTVADSGFKKLPGCFGTCLGKATDTKGIAGDLTDFQPSSNRLPPSQASETGSIRSGGMGGSRGARPHPASLRIGSPQAGTSSSVPTELRSGPSSPTVPVNDGGRASALRELEQAEVLRLRISNMQRDHFRRNYVTEREGRSDASTPVSSTASSPRSILSDSSSQRSSASPPGSPGKPRPILVKYTPVSPDWPWPQ